MEVYKTRKGVDRVDIRDRFLKSGCLELEGVAFR